MARVKMSSLVSQINGKFNGSQFVNTQYGLCLFNKAEQRRFPRSKQLQQRQQFRYLSSLWRNISPAEQAANNANALNYPLTDYFGNTYYLSGYALLLRSNLNLTAIGLPPIRVVPSVPPAHGSLVFSDLYASLTDYAVPWLVFTWIFSSEILPTDQMVVKYSPPIYAGVSNYNGLYFTAGVFDISDGRLDLFDEQVPYYESWQLGQRVFMLYSVIDPASGVEKASGWLSSLIV